MRSSTEPSGDSLISFKVLIPSISVGIICVYITNFFGDNLHFAYYVQGRANVTAFTGATLSKQRYRGACFATPMLQSGFEEVMAAAKGGAVFNKVTREETWGLRWKFFYETARAAWEQLEYEG